MLTPEGSGEAEAPPVSGGWWPQFDAYSARRERERRQRLRDEAEAEEAAREDAVQAEIAALLHAQEALDAERRDLERLRALVARNAPEGLSEAAQRAFTLAKETQSRAALFALQRELERQVQEEQFLLMAVLLADD